MEFLLSSQLVGDRLIHDGGAAEAGGREGRRFRTEGCEQDRRSLKDLHPGSFSVWENGVHRLQEAEIQHIYMFYTAFLR